MTEERTVANTSATHGHPPPPPGEGRLVSIDALRGFDMLWIMNGKYLFLSLLAVWYRPLPTPAWLTTTMEHTRWGGFSFWDLIMPLFLFLVGVAMPFSFDRQIARGASRRMIYRRMAARFAVLWVLGMMVQGNLLALDLSKLKLFSNVLQCIACGYVLTGLVMLHMPRRVQPWITVALLVGYWLALTFVPTPGLGAGVLEDGRNLAAFVDARLMGRFAAGHHTYILTIATFTATVMLGMHAGRLLQSSRTQRCKLLWLLAAGVAGLVLGWAWGLWFPINKPLWTSSMVLWSGGWCFLLLALFYGIIDVLHWRAWAVPLVVIGANPLLAYMLSHLFMKEIDGIGLVLFGGLGNLVEPCGWAPVVRTAGAVAVLWTLLGFLYRKKIFWRV